MIGSGKTVIGECLAARLGRPFLDLDREMDRELGRSFHELVREEGWLTRQPISSTAQTLARRSIQRTIYPPDRGTILPGRLDCWPGSPEESGSRPGQCGDGDLYMGACG
jgi:hypothetical protein